MKNKNGITLIALIITIIIMIVLVGVSLTFLVGDNSIIDKAKDAAVKYKDAAEKEKNMEIDDMLKKYGMFFDTKITQVSDQVPGEMEGSGTPTDPYVINSIDDLYALSDNVNSGTNYARAVHNISA